MCLTLRQGEIVLATIQDAEHNPRPALVITVPDVKGPDEKLFVVGISTDFDSSLPHHFPLGFHSAGHPRTGLKKRCAVKCDWTVLIRLADVHRKLGYVDSGLMAKIIRALDSMA